MTHDQNHQDDKWRGGDDRCAQTRTLPVGIAQFFGGHSGGSRSAPEFGPALAAAVMATLPALLVFILLQKEFVQGITSTGIKG